MYILFSVFPLVVKSSNPPFRLLLQLLGLPRVPARVLSSTLSGFPDFLGVGGIRTSFILRPCPKHYTGIYSVVCPKHWYLQRFRLFVQHTAQGCGTRKSVTSVHAFRDHAQNTKTLVFTAFYAQNWYLQRFRLFVPRFIFTCSLKYT